MLYHHCRLSDLSFETTAELPPVLTYLDQAQQEVTDNLDDFREQEITDEQPEQSDNHNALHRRYEVNVVIDHSDSAPAPVIYEDNSMHDNLVHATHMGTLITDFTLIKPGVLHRANGGYLILGARKIRLQPYAWEALKRTPLRTREVRIEWHTGRVNAHQ